MEQGGFGPGLAPPRTPRVEGARVRYDLSGLDGLKAISRPGNRSGSVATMVFGQHD